LHFEEMDFEIRAPRTHIGESVMPTRIEKNDPSKVSGLASEPAADLNETELLLRYTMFTHQWDLGEDLLITRASDGIDLTGTASSADRAASMRATLSTLPNVKVSITAPSGGERVGCVKCRTGREIHTDNDCALVEGHARPGIHISRGEARLRGSLSCQLR
jgi:hypothetical protein